MVALSRLQTEIRLSPSTPKTSCGVETIGVVTTLKVSVAEFLALEPSLTVTVWLPGVRARHADLELERAVLVGLRGRRRQGVRAADGHLSQDREGLEVGAGDGYPGCPPGQSQAALSSSLGSCGPHWR